MSEKTIEIFEKVKGRFFVDPDIDIKEKITEEEYDNLVFKKRTIGVNYNERVKFLEENGYKVTRENLVNSKLSVKK